MTRCNGCNCCFDKIKTVISGTFQRYGEFVGRHPWTFIVLNIVVFGGLGLGLLCKKDEADLEKVYFPRNSRAIRDRQYVRDTFPDVNAFAYDPFSQSEIDKSATVIFRSKSGTIESSAASKEISDIIEAVKSLSSRTGTDYADLCARLREECFVEGEFTVKPEFQAALSAGLVTYPLWNSTDLSTSLAGVNVSVEGVLLSATVIRVSFKLTVLDIGWMEAFITFCHSLKPNHTEVAYSAPDSLEEELNKSTKGDVLYFSLTITLVCVYASVVSSGGNPVSTRGALAFGGTLAAELGILGSMGLLCLCGVEFVNIVGVVPFLIIGIGVDDMFLLMSSWSENLPSDKTEKTVDNVPKLLGKTLATAGVGITITSLTDFLAFAIGSASTFLSVTNFSLYAGTAVLFCYIANATFFSSCLALHGRRVYSSINRFCLKTKPAEELQSKGKCYAHACGGHPPAGPRDDESACERIPGMLLPRLFQYTAVNIIILACFAGYLGVSVYAATQLKEGIALQDLVLDTSYFHKYLTISDTYFPTRVPVAFVVSYPQGATESANDWLTDLMLQAQNNEYMDPTFRKCWLHSYMSSPLFNFNVSQDFVPNLKTFLTNNIEFISDVVFDSTNTSIVASRCFLMSKPNNEQYSNAAMMQQMYSLADDSPLSVVAYHSSFVAFEQYLQVLPATLQLVGIAVAVMTVVTFILLPHPLMVLLVIITILMILVGIFGFMHLWGLTLSSITMIHLVMSVGFSVDFSAHVCAAYLMSDACKPQARAEDAIRHAAAPILNGATSTLLGVIFLAFSDSFVFQSFFKVMVLVIGFGVLHAVFFLPAVLSLVGPANKAEASDSNNEGQSNSQNTKTVNEIATIATKTSDRKAVSDNLKSKDIELMM